MERGDLGSRSIGWVVTSRNAWWAGHVARMWEKTNSYSALVGKHEGKSIFGRPSCKWRLIFKWFINKRDGRLWGLHGGLLWVS